MAVSMQSSFTNPSCITKYGLIMLSISDGPGLAASVPANKHKIAVNSVLFHFVFLVYDLC